MVLGCIRVAAETAAMRRYGPSSGFGVEVAVCVPGVLQCFCQEVDGLSLIKCLHDFYLVSLKLPDQLAILRESPILGS